METTVKECVCDKCGNEADMTIKCQTIEVEEPSGAKKKIQQEMRTCTVCGTEMVVNLGE
jgi:hypothetical protein